MKTQFQVATTFTLSYTGSYQIFTVPSGVTTLTIDAYGAKGGDSEYCTGGNGGQISSTISVNPAQILYVYIGGQGSLGYAGAGYNGGGSPIHSSDAGGGGATDIRSTLDSLTTRLVVAGGGGGASHYQTENMLSGGYGGYLSGGQGGSDGNGYGGLGGTQSAGGAGGYYSSSFAYSYTGTLGYGGTGGIVGFIGGSGGGGYYGGGGGVANGGGGGSSYTSGTLLSYSNGVNNGNGYMYITYTSSPTSGLSIIL